MKNDDRKVQIYEYKLQGFLLGLIPLTLLGIYAENPLLPRSSEIIAGSAVPLLLGWGVLSIFRYPQAGRILSAAGILLEIFLLYFEFISNPLLTLSCLLPACGGLYYLATARLRPARNVDLELCLSRFLGSSWGLMIFTVLAPLLDSHCRGYMIGCLISFLLMLYWAAEYVQKKKKTGSKTASGVFFQLSAIIGIYLASHEMIVLTAFLSAFIALIYAGKAKHADMQFLEVIIRHPARCLVLTFMALCTVGTLMLRTPIAMNRDLDLIHAAFTAVSGVCVTGLSTVDIAADLTLAGRFFLMLLIQLGGLGIMTLTSVTLHALGRLSLNQEQLISELTQSQERERDIFRNLQIIVRFTFITEALGALLLSWGFYNVHGDWPQALELGIFTSVSAFCNAGFFPGGTSLEPYAGESFLLLTTALLIIAGGIAPAVSCSLLQYRSFRKLPLVSKLVFGTTAMLLGGGTFLLLLFEWNGIFRELPLLDKLVNGFFQAATLRTAGFNSVSFSALGIPAYLIMIISMFIGGSPGGTAGGIKTTTLAVMILTFRAAVRNNESVSIDQRTIATRTVIQAVAVFMSAILVLLITVMMLVTTQALDGKALIFEAVSALATVGLSLGVTGELDTVGQVVIMGAMFIGRIGPLTLFLLLSDRRTAQYGTYAPIKVPLA